MSSGQADSGCLNIGFHFTEGRTEPNFIILRKISMTRVTFIKISDETKIIKTKTCFE